MTAHGADLAAILSDDEEAHPSAVVIDQADPGFCFSRRALTDQEGNLSWINPPLIIEEASFLVKYLQLTFKLCI